MNGSVETLRRQFGGRIGRALESCDDTIVYVDRDGVADVHRRVVGILEAHRADLPPETVAARIDEGGWPVLFGVQGSGEESLDADHVAPPNPLGMSETAEKPCEALEPEGQLSFPLDRDPAAYETMQRTTLAVVRLSLAQLERQGLVFSRAPVSGRGERTWSSIKRGNEAERVAAKRTREAWKAAGCPVYSEEDLPLFEDGAEAG